MAIERTLSIVKPNALAGNHIGAIMAFFFPGGVCERKR